MERPCVIVGRLANYVLGDHKNAVHVFISSSMEDKILKVERERKNLCKYFTGQEWGAASNYDITVKSSVYGMKETGIIVRYD